MESSIHIREYPANDESSKTLILFHDIGGGHYSFNHLIPLLVAQNVNVVVFDYIGHGHSSGTRGHFDSIEVIKEFLSELHTHSKLAQGSDVYTLALNQGALISLYYSTLYDNVRGNIFLNPRLQIDIASNLKNELRNAIPYRVSRVDAKVKLTLEKQSNDLTANNFITKKSLHVLQKLLKKVQLEVYFMDCRNLIFSCGRDSIIFETLLSDFRDEVVIPNYNSIKSIKKEDIIFKETYNWIHEN